MWWGEVSATTAQAATKEKMYAVLCVRVQYRTHIKKGEERESSKVHCKTGNVPWKAFKPSREPGLLCVLPWETVYRLPWRKTLSTVWFVVWPWTEVCEHWHRNGFLQLLEVLQWEKHWSSHGHSGNLLRGPGSSSLDQSLENWGVIPGCASKMMCDIGQGNPPISASLSPDIKWE